MCGNCLQLACKFVDKMSYGPGRIYRISNPKWKFLEKKIENLHVRSVVFEFYFYWNPIIHCECQEHVDSVQSLKSFKMLDF